MSKSLGIWLVRAESEPLANELQIRLGGELFRPWLNPDSSQQVQFKTSFHLHKQWIMLSATGIAVRFLDTLIKDKYSDPAVVVLDEAGRYAVALLSGHEGGANRLAYQIANTIGATPVISTATEVLKPLVIGIGCRKGIAVKSIEEAVNLVLEDDQLEQVREVATIDLKSEEPGLIKFCQRYNLPLRILSSATVAARSWVTKPSDWVKKNTGLDGVCEPSALIACGRGQLLVPKTTLDGVAVAVVKDIDWAHQ